MDIFASAGRLCSPIGQSDRSGGEICGISIGLESCRRGMDVLSMFGRAETPGKGHYYETRRGPWPAHGYSGSRYTKIIINYAHDKT